jgi:glycerol-3-phosphate acyltransferase PlsY
MQIIVFVILCICAYLVGAIPFGLIYSKIRGVDIRKTGSGNIGATNVGRAFGFWGGFVPVFLFDGVKGALPVLLVRFIGVDGLHPELAMIIAGTSAILGHLFPVYLKFKGGKGVATSAGVFLSIAPFHTAVVLVIFLIIYLITKIVAIASIVAAVALPLSIAFIKPEWASLSIYTLVVSIALSVLIIISHRSNIKKLLKKEDSETKK